MDNQKVIFELKTMGIMNPTYSLIQSKAGIHVYRVKANGENIVLKVFDNPDDAREIKNYHLLQSLGIPTLPLIGETATAILLPDIGASTDFRLGVENDMSDSQIMEALAIWYKALHAKGSVYFQQNATVLYDETDMLTIANMEQIAEVTDTKSNSLWSTIAENMDRILNRINALPRTLTYNDFYYTNLVVSKDHQTAFMFDYNLLGKGYVYSDIRNVTSSLSEDAARVFVEAYGMDNVTKKQAVSDVFLAPIITLCYACKRDRFPSWAKPSLEQIEDGTVLTYLYQWLEEDEQ